MPGIDEAPATVLALAASVPQLGPLPPRPIAWAERVDAWVIVFEDGRKLTFPKTTQRELTPRSGAVLLNPADGINDREAAAAGRAGQQVSSDLYPAHIAPTQTTRNIPPHARRKPK